MYWFRSGELSDFLPFVFLAIAWSVGGWLIARVLFRLEPRERIVAGSAVGLSLFLFLSNLAGHWLDPGAAFGLSGAAVLLLGLGFARRGGGAGWRRDLSGWPVIAGMAVGIVIFTLMGRGLAILDDRKNLSLISLMAAGDIPPHFYMNPVELFRYHYGFQLLGAAAVRLGGMFPWSAFDLMKGLMGGMAVGLAYLVGFRLTRKAAGGWILAGTLLFAGGARWLLLLLPPSYLHAIDDSLVLWGSVASGRPLTAALTGSWAIEGGPPVPIPFAYVGGILGPLILGLQAGPVSLAISILLLTILLTPRQRRPEAAAVIAVLAAVWALAWEAWFVLYAAGVVVVGIGTRTWRRDTRWRQLLWWTMIAVVAGGALSMVQGGTITEMARSVLLPGKEPGVAGGAPILSLRWPPAIVSSHLGELRVDRPELWPVALAELGAGVLAGVFVLWRSFHWARRGRIEIAVLVAGSVVGMLLPAVVRYEPDRDITRFSAFALLVWIVFSVPLAVQGSRRWAKPLARALVAGYLIVLNFSGIAILAALMTAMPRGVLTEDVAPLDASMASRLWDTLPENALVFDSHAWRAVPLTGRLTKTSDLSYEPLPDWLALLRAPSPAELAAEGFTHLYVDEAWWRGLSPASQASFDDPCVLVVLEGEDNADNGFRRMLDIRACSTSP